jgi:hypothetical protein
LQLRHRQGCERRIRGWHFDAATREEDARRNGERVGVVVVGDDYRCRRAEDVVRCAAEQPTEGNLGVAEAP